MADLEDVQGYARKFDNQREKVQQSESLADADRDAIQRWLAHLRTNDADVDSLGTIVGHLNRIRLAAERSELPLVEFDSIDDVNALELFLRDDHGLSDGTIRNYKKALRKFFAWRGADWAHEITIGASIDRTHDPDEEIDTDELSALLDACGQFDSGTREKALIALLRDTGLRIGAVLSLRVGDVDLSDRRATIQINENANVKDASGKKPLTWSRGYLANWLDIHPRPGCDDVALIHKTRMWDETDDGALRQQYAARRIKDIAEAAGLDPGRIHPHLFRGTAISEWIRDGMSDQQIKHRADWDEDSRQLSVYSLVSDAEMNDAIFEAYGIGESDDDRSPDLDHCPQCGGAVRGPERFCPSCGGPLDSTAAELDEQLTEGLFRAALDDLPPGGDDLLAALKERWDDPEFRAAFLDGELTHD